MAATWTYLLADLRTNVITAEIPLTGAKPSKKLGASGSMSGTWALSSKWTGGDPYGLTRPARTALYALRGDRPMYGGIVWTSQYDSDRNTVSLGSSDWWSYLDHRKALPLLPGSPDVTDIAQLAVTYEQIDQNQIARNLLTLAQSHPGGDIGIVADTTDSGILRDRTYNGYELTDVGQALKQLSEVLDGPDIMFDVASNLDTNGRPIRIMRLGTPLLGQSGSEWVFEWGANILAYRWPADGSRMATRHYATGDGMEAGAQIAVAEDTTAYTNGWPLLEADSDYHTVTEVETLQGHADADLDAARLPVTLPTVTVTGDGTDRRGRRVGPALGEYQPGDDCRIVITDPFMRDGIDVYARIIGIDTDPGEGGVEQATLTLAPLVDAL